MFSEKIFKLNEIFLAPWGMLFRGRVAVSETIPLKNEIKEFETLDISPSLWYNISEQRHPAIDGCHTLFNTILRRS